MLFCAYMSVEKYFFVEIWLYPSCGNPSSAIVLSLGTIKFFYFFYVWLYMLYMIQTLVILTMLVYLAFFCKRRGSSYVLFVSNTHTHTHNNNNNNNNKNKKNKKKASYPIHANFYTQHMSFLVKNHVRYFYMGFIGWISYCIPRIH
jgi:hypothetical protein